MRRILAFFIKQHVFGDLFTIIVIVTGVFALFKIRREIFPNVNFEIVQVITVFPGASPEEVEKLITNPIEQDLQEVDGIKKIQSYSTEGLSELYITLDPDRTTSEKGKTNVSDVIDKMSSLPDQSKKPIVALLESKQGPIIEVSVSGDVEPMELRRIAKSLETEIESISGVARIVHRGLRDLEIRVDADPKKLAYYRLSLDDVVSALKRQNVSIPGGTIEVSENSATGREKIVRTIGDFAGVEDVENTVIRANDLGQPVLVKQIAKVHFDLERSTVLTRTNGLPALTLTVLQKEKTDAIDVVDAVKAKVEAFRLKQPPQIKIDLLNDFSDFIKRRLSILTGNLGIGLLMVLLLLPLMIPFRFSAIIALGEPFAFLGTILVLYWMDHSINLISMIGLIIVSGILVDDSIVVTENAVRMVEDGKEPKEAAIEGTLQIMGPVTASVLTTTMAFLPMAFMSGIFGKFVREIPIAVITALGVSLLETFMILPAHVAHWVKIKPKTLVEKSAQTVKRNPVFQWLIHFSERSQRAWENKVVPKYLGWLEISLKRRYWVATGFTLFFLFSVGFGVKVMKFVLFPPDGVEIFFIQTQAPVGTSLDQHAKLLAQIEKTVSSLPKNEIDDFTTTVGLVQQDPNDPNTKRGADYAQIQVFLTPERDRTRTAAQIIEVLRAEVKTPPGLQNVSFTRVNTGPPTGKPISLGVRASKFEDILPAVAGLKTILKEMPGVTDISDSYISGKEEVRVNVHAANAASANLSVAQIGNTVRAAFEGVVATSIREISEEIDVRVSFPRESRTSSDALSELLIPNPLGNLVPLSSVASFKEGRSLSLYEHEKNQRQVKVGAEVDTNITTAIEANGKLKEMLPEIQKKFPNVSINFGGEDEDTQESFESLGRAFILAIMGIFLILVLTFKSILQPLVTLLTVPLGIISVIWAFFLHGLPLSFMGCLGIVALAGVIVNNAIVMVDFVNQRREEGAGNMESIMDAAKTRVRPIFLTTVTTVIGILPTAYGIGGLDMFVVPIAMALGWGLMFGSVLTAFVFPASLAILDDISGKFLSSRSSH
ncbi:MAG: efflux RND transporter permease subunit [Xanthomonadaceae bacterium]|nr:efflux RND transporter permease subunit [Xanthomonadaceae bacterium]